MHSTALQIWPGKISFSASPPTHPQTLLELHWVCPQTCSCPFLFSTPDHCFYWANFLFSFFHQPIKHSCSGLAMPTACFPKTIPASYPAGSSRSKSATPWNAQGVLATFISVLSSASWPLLRPLPLLHLCLDRSHAPPPSRARLPQFHMCLMSITVFYPTNS